MLFLRLHVYDAVQMVALECRRTSVLVSIVSHEHSHPCVNHVYMMYVHTYVYDMHIVVLTYVYM